MKTPFLYSLLLATGFRFWFAHLYRVETRHPQLIPRRPRDPRFEPRVDDRPVSPRAGDAAADAVHGEGRALALAADRPGDGRVRLLPGRTGHRRPARGRAGRQLLDEGQVLGIFPQGTCLPYRDRPWLRGAARLALATGTTIVPVCIVGSERALRPGKFKLGLPRIKVIVGEPIAVEPAKPTVAAAKALTARIEQAIEEARGPYGPPAHAWYGSPRRGRPRCVTVSARPSRTQAAVRILFLVANKKSRTPKPPRNVQAPAAPRHEVLVAPALGGSALGVVRERRRPRRRRDRDRRARLRRLEQQVPTSRPRCSPPAAPTGTSSRSRRRRTRRTTTPTCRRSRPRRRASGAPPRRRAAPTTGSGPSGASTPTPVNPRQVVHNEEHGAVVIWWGPKVPQSTVDQLRAFYNQQPDGDVRDARTPGLGNKIALTAWTGDPAKYYRNALLRDRPHRDLPEVQPEGVRSVPRRLPRQGPGRHPALATTSRAWAPSSCGDSGSAGGSHAPLLRRRALRGSSPSVSSTVCGRPLLDA